jgi:predicted nuclease with RNAse H fold
MNQDIDIKSGIVVGIDVGGPRKGFHAVALSDGNYLAKYAHSDATAMAAWCHQMAAQAIGIDAPCRWSSTGRARQAERALASVGISAFATPSGEAAHSRPFYHWMLNGAELFRLVEKRYPLYDGSTSVFAPVCFETFPQAVACALAGEIVSAKQKKTIRRDLLRKAGIDTSEFTNIDMVDAALCALTAYYLLSGTFKTYGDPTDGFIIVPASPISKRERTEGLLF